MRHYVSRLLPLLAVLVAWPLRDRWYPVAYGYTWAATQLVEGKFGPHVYDDEATMAAIVHDSGGRIHDVFRPNPPSMPLYFVWLLGLSEAAQVAAWNLGILGAALVSISLAWQRLPRLAAQPVVGCLLVAAFMLSEPMDSNLRSGQSYLWFLLFYVVVFWSVTRRPRPAQGWRAWLSGLALTLAFGLKFAGWPLWAWLAARREWTVARVAIVLTVLAFVLTLPVLGAAIWWYYLTVIIPGRAGEASMALTPYQTLNGFFQHLFRFDARLNPAPLADAPVVAALLLIISAAALIGVTLWLARSAMPAISAAAAVTLIPVLSPVAEQYHYLALLLPMAVAADAWLAGLDWRGGLALLAGIALVLLPLPFRENADSRGVMALLAYPRLYGALILWGYLVLAGRTPAKPSWPMAIGRTHP